MATAQVNRCIQALLDSGFQRSDFQVQVERTLVGYGDRSKGEPSRYYEYGRAQIVLWVSKDVSIPKMRAMLQTGHLDVTYISFLDKPILKIVSVSEGSGKFVHWVGDHPEVGGGYDTLSDKHPDHPFNKEY